MKSRAVTQANRCISYFDTCLFLAMPENDKGHIIKSNKWFNVRYQLDFAHISYLEH